VKFDRHPFRGRVDVSQRVAPAAVVPKLVPVVVNVEPLAGILIPEAIDDVSHAIAQADQAAGEELERDGG